MELTELTLKDPSEVIDLYNFENEGSGLLRISWAPSPYPAVDAIKGRGWGFFAPHGELACVEFLDVEWEKDHQALEFRDYTVEAAVKKGKVAVKLYEKKRQKRKAA